MTLKGKVDIGISPGNITPITKVSVVDYLIFQEILLVVMGELDKGPRTSTLPPKYEILAVMVQDMVVGLEIPTTTPC